MRAYLLGYTAIGIGLDLTIAPTSVATYRKRAYAKLDISFHNELFFYAFAPAVECLLTGLFSAW